MRRCVGGCAAVLTARIARLNAICALAFESLPAFEELVQRIGDAPVRDADRGLSADTPEPIKKVATIMVAELNKRFKLEGIPDASTLLAMKLNPAVNKGVVFSSSQRDAMNACSDLMYDKGVEGEHFTFPPSAPSCDSKSAFGWAPRGAFAGGRS